MDLPVSECCNKQLSRQKSLLKHNSLPLPIPLWGWRKCKAPALQMESSSEIPCFVMYLVVILNIFHRTGLNQRDYDDDLDDDQKTGTKSISCRPMTLPGYKGGNFCSFPPTRALMLMVFGWMNYDFRHTMLGIKWSVLHILRVTNGKSMSIMQIKRENLLHIWMKLLNVKCLLLLHLTRIKFYWVEGWIH